MKVVNQKLEKVVQLLRDYLKDVQEVTLPQVEAFASRYGIRPEVVGYVAKVILGRKLCSRYKEKYGDWIYRDELLKEAYVKGMEVEITDECKGEKIEGEIIDVTPASVVIRTKEGKEVEISKSCIPEWGLVYVIRS